MVTPYPTLNLSTISDIQSIRDKIIIVCGATASGKSSFAAQLSRNLDVVIINCDAVQVYKELPILTASPVMTSTNSSHKLYNIVSCSESFSVCDWLGLAHKEIDSCIAGRFQDLPSAHPQTPILVGGSGMYISALMDGMSSIPETKGEFRQRSRSLLEEVGIIKMYNMLKVIDPKLAAKLKSTDSQRIARGLEVFWQTGRKLSEWHDMGKTGHYRREDFFVILLSPPREELYCNINARFLLMLDGGLLREVAALSRETKHKAIGVKEVRAYLDGIMTLKVMIESVQQATRNYAKRQMTWFRNQIKPDIILKPSMVP